MKYSVQQRVITYDSVRT